MSETHSESIRRQMVYHARFERDATMETLADTLNYFAFYVFYILHIFRVSCILHCTRIF